VRLRRDVEGYQVTTVSLARAIRAGIPLVPTTDHLTFRFAADGREWAAHTAHKKPLLGADAMGTALVGLAGNAGKAVESAYDNPEHSPLAVLYRLYPELLEKRLQCPQCLMKKEWAPGRPPLRLIAIIRHLQDDHSYSRQQVAQFLVGM